jgi:hypothetical protein
VGDDSRRDWPAATAKLFPQLLQVNTINLHLSKKSFRAKIASH